MFLPPPSQMYFIFAAPSVALTHPFKSNRFPRARSQSRDLFSCSYIFPYCLFFYPENGSSTFLRSVGTFLKDYAVSISRYNYSYSDRCENLKYYQRKWQLGPLYKYKYAPTFNNFNK
jgi:hypothetical protein